MNRLLCGERTVKAKAADAGLHSPTGVCAPGVA